MTANETPENVNSVPAEKLPVVDVDRTLLDAGETSSDDAPKFPNAYREYLENHVPEEGTYEYQYMYLFGDQPLSMDAASRVPQAQVNELMLAAAAEAIKTWNPCIGTSDLTHGDA